MLRRTTGERNDGLLGRRHDRIERLPRRLEKRRDNLSGGLCRLLHERRNRGDRRSRDLRNGRHDRRGRLLHRPQDRGGRLLHGGDERCAVCWAVDDRRGRLLTCERLRASRWERGWTGATVDWTVFMTGAAVFATSFVVFASGAVTGSSGFVSGGGSRNGGASGVVTCGAA